MRLVLAICLLVGLALPGWAQEGFLPEFVEKQLSGEGRYVRLIGVSGLLSSKASIAEITIADDTGVWLRINQARIDWRRADLFSSKLTVNSLSAASIDVLRRPVLVGEMPTPEARTWAIPELPIAVDIGALRIDELRFAQEVFGLASVLRSEGSMKLEAGNLTAALDMVRLDGAGGDARLRVSYQKIVDLFDVSLDISEPAQGVIANALNLEGKPSVGLSLQGHGPVGSLDMILDLETGGQRRVSGQAFLRRGNEGLAFEADFSAILADVVGAKYRAIFAEPVTGAVTGVRRANDWQIEAFDLSGAGLGLKAEGVFAAGVFDGKIALESEGLDRFSALVGAPLGGAGSIEASGIIAPLAGTFDLNLNGSVTDLASGQDVVARLLRGETKLSGGLIRDAGGLRADALRLQSDRVNAVLNGAISSFGGDLTAALNLVDLADLGGPVSGAGQAELAVKGSVEGGFAVTADFAVPEAEVSGWKLQALTLGLDGNFENGDFDGKVLAQADVEARTAILAADMNASRDGVYLTHIDADWAGVALVGGMGFGRDQMLEGQVVLRADEIADVASAFGLQANGSVEELEINATRKDGQQQVLLMLDSAHVATGGAEFSDIAGRVSIKDAFGSRRFEANIGSATVKVGSLLFETLRLQADNAQGLAAFDLAGRFSGADLTVRGRVLELGSVPRVGIDVARLANAQTEVALKTSSEIVLNDGQIIFAPTVLASGEGELEFSGSFGNALAASVTLADFPLAASALVWPGLAVAGIVSGDVNLSGSAEAPVVQFDLTAREASSGMLLGFGLPPLNLVANGSFADGTAKIDTATAQGAGVNVSASGVVPVAGTGMDLAVLVSQLDLALLDDVLGRQGVAGKLAGSALVTGDLGDPAVSYDFRATGLSLAALQAAGIGAFSAEALGDYRSGTIKLGRTEVRGPGGLGLTATGAVSLTGGPLALSVSGDLPLALVNGILAGRGAQADGRIQLSARVGGTLALPDVNGNVTIENGTFSDSATNLRLNQVALDGRFDGQSVVIASGSARSSVGGSMEISGSLGFGKGLVPDISMQLNNLAYADGRTVVTRLTGELSLKGPLNGGAVLAGDLTLGETQVVIPEGSNANGGALLEVRHRGQSAPVQATLDRISANAAKAGSGIASNVRVDISVNAPGRIFVRGRGLDSEVRGSLRMSGTLGDVVPVGSFDLVRGRFAILGQRFDFRQGNVTLEGNLDPTLDFRAETQSGDVTVIVTVSGPASDPSVVFSSLPELPQDEVIALLIFNRGLGELSPFQLVQLAAAVRELNGGRDDGLFSQIRNAAGLDDLDIQTDADGSAVVKAGKYLEENIYLELEAGTKGTSRATINLDLSDNVTAKASAGSDGESGVGVFYERDY